LPETTQILFIAEGPGNDEDIKGTMLLIGKAGMFLNECIKIASYDRNDPAFGFINTVKCRAVEEGKNRQPKDAEINACYDFIEQEIKQLPNLKVIICLGNTAANRIFGKLGLSIFYFRNNIIWHSKYNARVIVTYHPAAPLHSTILQEKAMLRSAIVEDIQKAVNLLDIDHIPIKHTSYVCDNMNKVEWLFKQLNNQEIVSWDIETDSLDYLNANILCHSFSWQAGTGVILPLLGQYSKPYWNSNQFEKIYSLLKDFLENNNIKKIAHNGKFDVQHCRSCGIDVQGFYADTMLMHYLTNENIDHNLKLLAWLFTDYGGYEESLKEIMKDYAKENEVSRKEASYNILPSETLWSYASKDADTTFQLFFKLLPILEKENTINLFYELYMPFIRLVSRII
jgi:uracil-DNA glycosylase family 4